MILTRETHPVPVRFIETRRRPGPVLRASTLPVIEVRATTMSGRPIDNGEWLCPFRSFRACGGMREIAQAVAQVEARQKLSLTA